MRLALLLLLAATSASAQGTGTIAGQVLEDDGITSVIGGNVRVDGTTLGSLTDLDGYYRIVGVPVGTFAVTASYFGYASQTRTGVDITTDSASLLNFSLAVGDFRDYQPLTLMPPMFTNDVYNVRIIHGEDLELMPVNR